MNLNPKKLSFSTLAILFAAHVGMCLFAGVLFAPFMGVSPMIVAFVLFLVSHFFRIPQNVLAEITITDTTYAGEFYNIFLSKILLGFETAAKGLVKIETGIKKKKTIGLLTVDGFIQASQDPPVYGGEVDVDGRVLEPLEVMGYMEASPSKFEDHWLAVQMNPALLDRALPVSFESAVLDRTGQLTSNWIERIFWQGDYDAVAIAAAVAGGLAPGDSNLIFFDGIIKVTFDSIPAINKITTALPVGAEAAVLSAANIKAKFDQLKAKIMASADGPAAYNDPNFVFIVNYKTGSLYGDAIKAQANKGDDFTGRGNRTYDGKRIVEVAGQHDDTIWAGVATRDNSSQLWLGANEADEWTKFQVAKLQANSEKIFVKMLTKLCTQIALPEQVWLYTTKY